MTEHISEDVLRQITGMSEVIDTEEINNDLSNLELELMNASLELETAANAVDEDAELVSQTEKEIAEIRKAANDAIMAANAKIMAAREARFDRRKELIAAKNKKESIERQIDQARRAKLAARTFKMLETKWEEVFARLSNAFPHQMNGARKMAQQRKLILADTMGLGKTYTALIACDLIQSMTEEASEAHPIIFDE